MNKLLLLCLAVLFVFTIQAQQQPNGQRPTDKPKDDTKKCLHFKTQLDHLLAHEVSTDKQVFVEMPQERKTDEYKNRAIEKIKEIYGWDFNQEVEGAQLFAGALNPEFRHILGGAYGTQLKENAFPSSNVKVHQDFWAVKVMKDDGIDIPNMSGKKLFPDSTVGYGEFLYLDDQGKEVLPKIIYWNKHPLTETYGLIPLVLELESEEFGKGLLIGGQTTRDVDGKKFIIARSISTFPETLELMKEGGEGMIQCKDILLKKKMDEKKEGGQTEVTKVEKTNQKIEEEKKGDFKLENGKLVEDDKKKMEKKDDKKELTKIEKTNQKIDEKKDEKKDEFKKEKLDEKVGDKKEIKKIEKTNQKIDEKKDDDKKEKLDEKIDDKKMKDDEKVKAVKVEKK